MNEIQFRAIWPFKMLSAVSNTRMWDGSALSVVGVCQVRVVYEGKLINDFLFVCRGDGPALLGRTWYRKFDLIPYPSTTSPSVDTAEPAMHVHAARGTISLAPKEDPRAHYREYIRMFPTQVGYLYWRQIRLSF